MKIKRTFKQLRVSKSFNRLFSSSKLYKQFRFGKLAVEGLEPGTFWLLLGYRCPQSGPYVQ